MTRLGFALLLQFFEVEARFSASAQEVPAATPEYVAQQVKVPAKEWAAYDWQEGMLLRVAEAAANEAHHKARVRTVLRSSYSAHWRRMLSRLAITRKHGEPWIRASPRGKQDEPESLVVIKAEIERRWAPSTCWTS